MELNELMKKYLSSVKYSVKTRTYIGYHNIFNYYIADTLKNVDLAKISNNDLNNIFVEKYCKNQSVSTSSLKLIKGQINRCLNFGEKQGYIPHFNIDVPIKTNSRKVEFLSDKEILAIENHILSRKLYYKYGFLISLYTGLRIGELLALKWQDIDFENNSLKVNATACDIVFNNQIQHLEDKPKTLTSEREIPLTRQLKTLLKDLKKHSNGDYVISTKKGNRVQVRSYQESFSRLLTKLKIKHYGFHSLRHTFATRCNIYGMDIKTLSELLGHSSPSITLKVYVHTDIDIKRQALNKVNKKIKPFV